MPGYSSSHFLVLANFRAEVIQKRRSIENGEDCQQQSCSPSNSHFGRRNINSRNTKRNGVCWDAHKHMTCVCVCVVYANSWKERVLKAPPDGEREKQQRKRISSQSAITQGYMPNALNSQAKAYHARRDTLIYKA